MINAIFKDNESNLKKALTIEIDKYVLHVRHVVIQPFIERKI